MGSSAPSKTRQPWNHSNVRFDEDLRLGETSRAYAGFNLELGPVDGASWRPTRSVRATSLIVSALYIPKDMRSKEDLDSAICSYP